MNTKVLLSVFCLSFMSCLNVVLGADVPSNSNEVSPVLVGTTIPDIELKTGEGESVGLKSLLAEKPTVLVYYRGGWCPICTRQLQGLAESKSVLTDLGFQIIAVSADKPEKVKEGSEKGDYGYTLYSDNTMAGAKALGIAFKLEAELVKFYKEQYRIDIERDSGFKHHILPVPSVFIVSKEGLIEFSYVNPDYKTRLNKRVLLAAAHAALE